MGGPTPLGPIGPVVDTMITETGSNFIISEAGDQLINE